MTLDFTKSITTRDGRAVRILCTDGPHPTYPVIGICEGDTSTSYWAPDGEHCKTIGFPGLVQFDLINPPVKQRGWVAIYTPYGRTSVFESTFDTEQAAREKCPGAAAIVQLPERECSE
jgi:hypothetical protein